jgi:hypothetical protein
MKTSPLAGKPAPTGILVDVPRLITAYYTGVPDPKVPAQRVAFGTSGHRGSPFNLAFNEWHILAITQAICLYRKSKNIVGPLFRVLAVSVRNGKDRWGAIAVRDWMRGSNQPDKTLGGSRFLR